MVATHRPPFEQACLRHLGDAPRRVVRGNGFPSCAKLWNECIIRCPTERVIICNEKARPSCGDFAKLELLLERGYGFVGLYLFGFFGFDKELIRRVGFFDERFLGGWYEDNDFVARLAEANIGGYFSRECEYELLASSWTHDEATAHWKAKWRETPGGVRRVLPEVPLPYDLGPSIPRDYLPATAMKCPPETYQWMLPPILKIPIA